MLRHTFRVRSTLRHFRSVPFQTARLLHDSDNSPSTYHDAPFDLKLNNLRSEMMDINKATITAIDDRLRSLGDKIGKLSMEIKNLSMTIDTRFTTIDAKFEISDMKTQSKFDILRGELRDRDATIQSKFDTLRIEMRDREAQFWARAIFTLLAIAGLTTSAAVLQYQNRTIQTSKTQTPIVQTPTVQAPTVGQK